MNKFEEAYKIVLEGMDISGNRILDGLLNSYIKNKYKWEGCSRFNANQLARLFKPSPLGSSAKDALVLYYANRPYIVFPKEAEKIFEATIEKYENENNISLNFVYTNIASVISKLSDKDIENYFPNFANICMSSMRPDTLRKMSEYINEAVTKQNQKENDYSSYYNTILPNNKFYRSLKQLYPNKQFAIMEGIDPRLRRDLGNPSRVLPILKNRKGIPVNLTSRTSNVKYAYVVNNNYIVVFDESNGIKKTYTIVYN